MDHNIIAEYYSMDGELVINKPGKGHFIKRVYTGFYKTEGIKTLIVCGVTAEVCVNTTVRGMDDRGDECIIPQDCVGS